MNELEDRLRDTLTERADRAPDGSDLLDRVYRRDRQVTVRRRTVLAAALTLGVGAAAGTAVAVTRGHGPTDTLNPTPTGPPPSERLERATSQVPAFPLTPSWIPAGFHREALQVTVGYLDGLVGGQLGYGTTDRNSAVNILLLMNSMLVARADVEAAPHEVVQVNGTPAYWVAGGTRSPAVLYWQRREDQWVGAQWMEWTGKPQPPEAKDTMIRFLAGLVDQPIPIKAPFRISWVPKHARLNAVDKRQLLFQIPPRGGDTATGPASGTFAVSYWTPKQDGRLPQDQQPIAIRGWKHCTIGTIKGGGDDVGADHLRYMVFCRIGPDRYVNVTAPTSLLTIGDMVSITEGITIVK
jgi:hypothetical protein